MRGCEQIAISAMRCGPTCEEGNRAPKSHRSRAWASVECECGAGEMGLKLRSVLTAFFRELAASAGEQAGGRGSSVQMLRCAPNTQL